MSTDCFTWKKECWRASKAVGLFLGFHEQSDCHKEKSVSEDDTMKWKQY